MTMQSGCATRKPALTAPGDAYRRALQQTAASADRIDPLAAGESERMALANLMAMFEDFSKTNVTRLVRSVYDEDVYLRDGFKELQGLDNVAPYMIRSTEPLRHCTFTFEDVARHDTEYYLRWVMEVNMLRDPPERVSRVIGMSHVRFNAAGKVIFQQDYWDPSDVLYARIPVAGWLINKVKERL
jgi:hypothetical protein